VRASSPVLRLSQWLTSAWSLCADFKKIDNYVSFPLTVDIAPFFAPARVGAPATTTNLSAKAKRTVHDVSDSVNYELTAVVVHLGSMGGGHYSRSRGSYPLLAFCRLT
jgi:ubiquitin C-terminal hydrolase